MNNLHSTVGDLLTSEQHKELFNKFDFQYGFYSIDEDRVQVALLNDEVAMVTFDLVDHLITIETKEDGDDIWEESYYNPGEETDALIRAYDKYGRLTY